MDEEQETQETPLPFPGRGPGPTEPVIQVNMATLAEFTQSLLFLTLKQRALEAELAAARQALSQLSSSG